MPVTRRLAVALVAIALVSGCSTVVIGDAQRLAQTGSKAASSMEAAVTVPRDQLDRYVRSEYLRSGLQPGISPPSPQTLASIASIKSSLAARASALDSLGTLYGAFGDLAAYDAGGEFAKATSGAVGAVNGYARTVGADALVTAQPAAALSSGAGLIGEEVQKRKLREASAIVRGVVEQLAAVLTAERDAVTALLELSAQETQLVLIQLWEARMLDARPLLEEFATAPGLAFRAGPLTAESERLRPAVTSLLRYDIDEQQRRATASYDASLRGLTQLAAEHRKFEAGAPLTLELVEQQLARLKAIFETVKSAR
jgi:hypothetical protein